MSGTIRGPEPPFIGAVYVAMTKSGRRWEVIRHNPRYGWRLWPMDAHMTGGGVRALWRSTEELRDRKKWRMRGVTSAAALGEGQSAP